MDINIKNEAENIANKLDLFKPHERLSILENDVESLVKKFRDSLNEEITEKLNQNLRKSEPAVCKQNHSLYRYEDKKKTST